MKKILSVLIALLLLCTIVMAQPMEKNTIARRYSNIVALDAGIIKNGSSVIVMVHTSFSEQQQV